MKKVVVSAPGKLHLSGEHAVVYGKPAVLVSTSLRLYVTLASQKSKRKNQKNISKVKNEESYQPSAISGQIRVEKIRKEDAYIGEIVRLVEKKHQVKLNGFSISIDSSIPQGVGMGSSAALAVALVGALTQWIDKPWDISEINKLAYEAEKYQHGNPSGGDNTIASFGGILWYRRELEFLKTFWLLPFKIPKSFPSVVIVNTQRSETTKDMVQLVAKVKRKWPETKCAMKLDAIEQTTRNVVQSIHDESVEQFLQAITDNERLLEKLGVVSLSVRKFIKKLERHSAAAKISGAGGVKDGSGMVLCCGNAARTIKTAQAHNYETYEVDLGGEGVRREQVVI